MKIVSSAQMAEIDRKTIEEMNMPGIVLMENAAGCFCRAFIGHLSGKKPGILVLCGSGNNGGDGFAIARILHCQGYLVRVIHAGREQSLKEDARINWKLCSAYGIPIYPAREEGDLEEFSRHLQWADWIVDALFGTGLSRQVVGTTRKVMEMAASCGKKVAAVDLPSGINGDNGHLMAPVMPATLTVTFGLPKWGHFLFPGAEYVGQLYVASIGFPPEMLESPQLNATITKPEFVARLIPRRGINSHKSSNGKLALLGGSKNTLGAITLAGQSAMSAGCGYVCLYVPNILESVVKTIVPDIISEGMPDIGGGYLKIEATDIMLTRTKVNDALVLGPGLGQWQTTRSVVVDLLEESRIPVVIDADALNAIYQEGVEHSSDAPWVMTPHLGEAGRLLGMTPEVFAQDLLANTKKLVERYRAVVLIKGTYTLIMNTDGRIYINTTGNPVLSVMGTGDILSGIIGALIARGIEPFSAAASGAFIHGLMGDLAAGDLQPEGIPPSRLIPYIPSAMEQIRQGMVESRIRIIS